MSAVWNLLEPHLIVQRHVCGRDGEPETIEELVESICTRRLDEYAFPLVHLDTSYVKSRTRGSAVYETVVLAGGLASRGELEPLGVSVGDSESRAFWVKFLQSLRARGLHGVQRVIAEEHAGLEDALAMVFPDASWERAEHGPVLALVEDQDC